VDKTDGSEGRGQEDCGRGGQDEDARFSGEGQRKGLSRGMGLDARPIAYRAADCTMPGIEVSGPAGEGDVLPQDHQEPETNPVARAIVLLAVSVMFLGGSIMVGFGAPHLQDSGGISLGLGIVVLIFSGIILSVAVMSRR